MVAKKSDYSLFIIFFFNSLKNGVIHYFWHSIFTIHYFWGSLFTIHYKKGHHSLIIIPHPDPHITLGENITLAVELLWRRDICPSRIGGGIGEGETHYLNEVYTCIL